METETPHTPYSGVKVPAAAFNRLYKMKTMLIFPAFFRHFLLLFITTFTFIILPPSLLAGGSQAASLDVRTNLAQPPHGSELVLVIKREGKRSSFAINLIIHTLPPRSHNPGESWDRRSESRRTLQQ